MKRKPTLVYCLGNEVLSDDAFGKYVAEALLQQSDLPGDCEVLFSTLAGFHLLDELQNRERVLIVDSLRDARSRAGALQYYTLDSLPPSNNLINSHQISLPVSVALGRKLGYELPTTIDVLAVTVADVETLSEELTPAVAAAVPEAVEYIRNWIKRDASTQPVFHIRRTVRSRARLSFTSRVKRLSVSLRAHQGV